MSVDNVGAWLIAGLTIIAGGLVWLSREAMGRKRSKRMESYLRLERGAGTERAQRSTKQVMAALGMTAGQVMDAAKRSRAIKRLAIVTNMTSAEAAVFECAPY